MGVLPEERGELLAPLVMTEGRGAGGRRARGDLPHAVRCEAIEELVLDTVVERVAVLVHGPQDFALVANADPYSYVGRVPLRIAPKAKFELGLDLVAPREIKARRLPQVAAWALAGTGQQRSPHVLYVHDADELVVRADRPMPLQVDGEDLGDVEEAHFEAERSALRVLVPE